MYNYSGALVLSYVMIHVQVCFWTLYSVLSLYQYDTILIATAL